MNDISPQQKPVKPVVAEKSTKSGGEKLFDRAVYGGLAGVGTFAATLGIAYQLRHGNWSGGRYARTVEWTERQFKRFLPESMSRKAAEESVMTTSLMMGGNAMLVPIGAAEHYKVPIVRGLNSMLGDTTPSEKVEMTPKQTLWSLIEGRMVAWSAVFVTLFSASLAVPKTFQTFMAEVGERTHAVVQWAKGSKPTVDMKTTKAYRLGEIGALDVFATIAAASILYVGGHFFARKHEEKKSGHDPQRLRIGGVEMPEIGRENDATLASASVSGAKEYQGRVAEASIGQQRG